MKQIKSLYAWVNKHYNEIKDNNYCYCNIQTILSNEDIDKINKYYSKRPEINFIIYIIGIKQLRAQRTWYGLPEWFRSNNMYYELHYEENSFVFISCVDETKYDGAAKKEELLKSLDDIKAEVPECRIVVKEFDHHRPIESYPGTGITAGELAEMLDHMDPPSNDPKDIEAAREKILNRFDKNKE